MIHPSRTPLDTMRHTTPYPPPTRLQYVSEVVGAICEAPLKVKDVAAALAVCSALHQRYAEFARELVGGLAKLCVSADEEKAGVARKRAVLRLLVELLLAGLYSAHSVLLHIVKHLVAAADFQKDAEGAQASLSLLTALARAGREELLGLPHTLPVALAPASLESGEEGGELAAAAEAYRGAVARYEAALASRHTLPPEAQQQLRASVERCFEAACEALQGSHAALQATEAENARVLNNRGDLPEDMAAAYEAQRKAFEGLQRTAAQLGEVLDRLLPELKQGVTRIAAAADGGGGGGAAPADQAQQVFEDEETRSFYESLVDLRTRVPAVLLGEKGKESEQQQDGTAASGEQQEGAEGGGGGGKGAAAEGGAAAAKSSTAGSGSKVPVGDDSQEVRGVGAGAAGCS
jgi:regulator of nonsense transcripts 2